MSFWLRLKDRLTGRADRDLERELRAHLELETEEQQKAGLLPEPARYAAQRAFGNTALVKEDTRAVWGWTLLDQLLQDLRYGVRTLLRTPVFSIVAVLCLALGIGANTAIFSLVDAALLRMLPVTDPQRLVGVQNIDISRRGGSSFSYPSFLYLRRHADAVAGVFAYSRIDLNFSAGDLTDAPAGLLVSDNYFSVLGVQPVIGRAFTSSDEAVIVLSYRYWRTRFHGDPAITGRGIVLNGLPFTVVGVSPRRFLGVEVGSAPDVFVPLAWCDRLSTGKPRLPMPNSFWLSVMARLRPEVPASQAAAQTDLVYHQGINEQALPGRLARHLHQQQRITFVPGAKGMGGIGEQFGKPLLILMTVVALVLLIACANVANLLLARAAARRKEIAVRLALGAGRVRLVRQFLTESLVLSGTAGVLGLLFGVWSARALIGLLTNRVLDVTLDARVLAFTLLASFLTGLLFGVAPGLRAMSFDLTPAFKGDAAPESPRRFRFGGFLVSGQVAMSLLLLIGAGLFIRTLGNLRAMDAGFHGDHVLLATLNPGLSRYTIERSDAFFADLLQRVSAIPGVRFASLADAPLLSGTYIDGFSIEGSTQPAEASIRVVGPGFFETMGIEVRAGRDFLPSDDADSPKVAIVNQTMAGRYFAGVNPIGKRIGDKEIIGVIADTKYRRLRQTIPNTVYLALGQATRWSSERTLHVRTIAGPAGMAAAVREQVRALDKNLPVEIRLFPDLVDEDLAQERLIAHLSGFFAGLALLLTAMGLYGVIAYNVQRRTRELGIRISLGARRPAVVWLVLRDCLLLAGLGVAAGVPASFWLSHFVASQLFGIAPGDPATIAAAASFLIIVAALAGYLPARRASHVDPMTALRHE